MRSFDEIKLDIHKLYSELGKDPQELRGWEEDYGYKIQRKIDGALVEIPIGVIDDYFGSEPGSSNAKEIIKKALSHFKQPKYK
jgi:hypothetical protein